MTKRNAIDLHIGGIIRRRRIQLGKNQQWLGNAVGTSYQQVQKDEKGDNSVAPDKLLRYGAALGLNPCDFIKGFDAKVVRLRTNIKSFEESREALEFLKALALFSQKQRKILRTLMRVILAGDNDNESIAVRSTGRGTVKVTRMRG
jgi:transcriptional regulator with XRE-family HTH domain